MRRASSLILMVPSEHGYRILMMKRALTLRFLAGYHAFPGGTLDKCDEQFQGNQTELEIDKLTAIRETFEETGILIMKGKDPHLTLEDREAWRVKVQQNGSEFQHLCEHFHIQPDLDRLYYWSNWITPETSSTRFDTRFFITWFDHLPDYARHHPSEASTTDWFSPKEALQLFIENKILLIDPQLYTIYELSQYSTIQEVTEVAKRREVIPIQPQFHFDENLNDAIILLPGDFAYSSRIINERLGLPKPADRNRMMMKRDNDGRMFYLFEQNVNPNFPKELAEKYKFLSKS